MLEMDERRMSFADSLRPPQGYRASFIVGTTYSLDLRALLGICIPLGLGFEPEALDNINPVSLFAALQELQGKMVIYCDKGHINADFGDDSRSRGLAILLEDMIHQVHVNRNHPQRKRRFDGLSSFHPKVWIAEYEPIEMDGPSIYRLIVMSRNLTFDTSWNAAVSIDGYPGKENACARHVAEFLEFLATGDSLTETEKDNARKKGSHVARVRRLAQAVRSVEFELDNKVFCSVDFLPFGPHVKGKGSLLDAASNNLFISRYGSLLIVSPFLSDAGQSPLQLFRQQRVGQSGRFMLLSREDSLLRLGEDIRAAYECYSPVSWLADVALEGEDAPNAADYSNLHAKMYFGDDAFNRRHLYIGSLNASRNGVVNNVEAMLHLEVTPGYLTFERFITSFIGDSRTKGAFAPFMSSCVVSDADEQALAFQRAFQAFVKAVEFESVTAVSQESEMQLIAKIRLMSAADQSSGISCKMKPLLAELPKPLGISPHGGTEELVFGPLRLEQISALFILEGTDAGGHSSSCIIVCPRDRFHAQEASRDARSSALLESILKSRDGSLALYIAHAFGLQEGELGDGFERKPVSREGGGQRPIAPALYECLLEKAYSEPGTIERAEYLLDLIPESVNDSQVEALKALVRSFRAAMGR